MASKKISRRKFFKIAGLTLGASTLACGGLGYAATQAAPKPLAAQVETPSYTFGKADTMKKTVLVAYATRTGSTVGVASAIGEAIAGRGYAVEVKPVSDNPDPGAYDLVILGSAVNGARWLPEAVEYVRRHQQALRKAPVAMFCVHILNLGEDETSRRNRQAYLNEARSLVVPVDEGFFSGKGLDPENTAPILLWVLRAIKLMPEGDARDWTKIGSWAQTVFA